MQSTMPATRTTGVRNQAAVRDVLDSVRAAGRASLSVPEAKRRRPLRVEA